MRKPQVQIGKTSLKLDTIRIDGGTQMRAEMNEEVVAEYAHMIRDGADFEPVIVFFDGSNCWLGDGFHRVHAYRKAGAFEIPADVRQGLKRDAILFSVSANAMHGLRRSNADKRKAVETLLSDKEWASWSDREIARTAKVSAPLVATVREALSVNSFRYAPNASPHLGNSPDSRTVERNGTAYQQNTANIGKAKPATMPDPIEAADGAPPAGPVKDAAARAEEQSARRAQQAEHDRWREQNVAALPEHIQQAEAAREARQDRQREAASDAADDDGLTPDQRIAELRAHIVAVEAENGALKAENAKFEAMRVQFEQGGFEKVVAGKDEEIRVLKSNVQTENDGKIAWMKKAKWGLKELKAMGWKPDVQIIDPKTGEFRDA